MDDVLGVVLVGIVAAVAGAVGAVLALVVRMRVAKHRTDRASQHSASLMPQSGSDALALPQASQPGPPSPASLEPQRDWQQAVKHTRRQQETFNQTLLKITATLNSTLDLDRLMHLILESSREVVRYDSAHILMLDRSRTLGRISYMEGYSEDEAQALAVTPIQVGQHPLYASLMQTRQTGQVEDTWGAIAGWQTSPCQRIRSYASAPLMVESRMIGFLTVDSNFPHNFSEVDVQHLQILANHAANALKNAQLYDKVSRLEQVKSDMLRLAAHDLKNPLMMIKGYADLLVSANDAMLLASRGQLHLIIQSATRMQQMIGDLLSLDRIEHMADSANFEGMVLGELAERAVVEFTPHAAKKSLTLTFERGEAPGTKALGDAVLLYEAMTNLISNAIKYTPEGGTIRVAVTQEPQAVCFVVMDTGIGIPADRQRNLFQPFARARTQESEDTEGTGLGLHLVKRIVERHSGEIRFTSEYGKGSTFGFQIPIMRRPISKPLMRVKDEGSQTTPPAS